MSSTAGLPRPYRGQAWMDLRPLGEHRGCLEVHALVNLTPAVGEQGFVPQLTRSQVGDLIGQLDGTSPGRRRDHHTNIARITWADDGVNLTIIHQPGTDAQRVSHAEPDDRGLYTIELDKVIWLPTHPLTGMQRLELALAKLQQTSREPDLLTQAAIPALGAVGAVLADVLADAGTEPRQVIDLISEIMAAALRRLRQSGDSTMAFAFAHAVAMQADQLRVPIMQQLTMIAAASPAIEPTSGTVVCVCCGARTLAVTARLQPKGWNCPLCVTRSEQVMS